MEIKNDFAVRAPVEHVWSVLTDLEVVAPCIPGASLTGRDGDDYLGKIKVKVGPVTSEFKGVARFDSLDAAAHTAVIAAKGQDTRGGGNASARITADIAEEGEMSRVSVVTDMEIAGKLAQFGAGMIQQISEKLMGEFARRLEIVIASNGDDDGALAEAVASPESAPVAPAEAAAPAADPVPAVAEEPSGGEVAPSGDEPAKVTDPPVAATVATATIAPPEHESEEGLPANFVYIPPVPGEPYAYELTSASAGRTTYRNRPKPSAEEPSSPEPEVPETAVPEVAVPAVEEPVIAAPDVQESAPAGTAISGRKIVTFDDDKDGEALDLMELAGGTILKRFLPVIVIGAVVVVGLIVWLVVR